MINADFTALTILISMGATLGKTTPLQLVIMTLIECVLAQVNRYIGIALLLVRNYDQLVNREHKCFGELLPHLGKRSWWCNVYPYFWSLLRHVRSDSVGD
jgi:hypothetical protein